MRAITEFFLGQHKTITITRPPVNKHHDLLAKSNSPYQFPENSLSFPVETFHPPRFVDKNNEPLNFDVDNPEHVEYIRDCNQLFKDTFKRLKNSDSFNTILCVSYILTIIPQFILRNRPYSGHIMQSILAQKFTTEAVCYTDEGIAMTAIWYQGERRALYKEYREIFVKQIHNMIWATGYWDASSDPEMLSKIQRNTVINDLILTMSEVLTIDEIRAIVSDRIEGLFLNNAQALHDQLYSGRRQSVNLSLYGYQSDFFINYLKAPALYVLDRCGDAVSYTQSFSR